MEKYGFVYIWRDRKHNRYYIGCHWGHQEDSYICSSRWMRNTYRRRPEDFRRRILAFVYTTREDLYQEEYKWLCKIKPEEMRVKYYNLCLKKFNHWTSDEEKSLTVREKLSKTGKQKHQDPEYQKIFEAGREKIRGRKQTPEVVAKRAAAIKVAKQKQFPIENRKVRSAKGSAEHSAKLSEASKKRWAQPDAKEKQAKITREQHLGKQHRLGQKNTPEHIAKIVACNTGKKRTADQIEHIRQANMGRKQPDQQKAAASIRTKEMWEKRRQGLLPMPVYNKNNLLCLVP